MDSCTAYALYSCPRCREDFTGDVPAVHKYKTGNNNVRCAQGHDVRLVKIVTPEPPR